MRAEGRRIARRAAGFGRRRTAVGATLTACLVVAACSDVLSVDTPDIVRPENLDTRAGLAAFRAGAYGDFVRSFTGDGADVAPAGHVQIVCLFTDECHSTNTQGDDNETDARRTTDTNGDVETYYTDLHRTRAALESGVARFQAAAEADAREEAIAEMQNLAGYVYLHLAEAFCSGVPFSESRDGSLVFGQQETTEQVLQRAVARFEAGIQIAEDAGIADLAYLGRVGLARALLSLGDYGAAAAAVAPVPTDFLYTVKYSTNTPSQENGVFNVINVQQRNSVTTNHGDTGLDFFGAYDAGDPRTPYEPAGRGFDETDHFRQLKYPTAASPIPLASGIEARLTEAEAFLDGGDVGGFQSTHDALRATIGLGSVDVTSMTDAERVAFHFQERAFWTWLEGKRLGDLRRMVRHYGLAPDAVYPSGAYFRPHYPTFGERVSLPIPLVERDNPNYTGACLSESP